MSTTILVAATIVKAASPIIKDLYNKAKGEVRKSLDKWSTTALPKEISKSILSIDNVKTIWSPEKSVSLRKFYYPSRIQCENETNKKIEFISSLGEGNFVIEGIVGQGKSILLRYLALQEILKSSNPKIPIFLELRKISKSTSLMDLIFSTISAYDVVVNDATFKYLAGSGKIAILLDGFDELETERVRDTTLEIERLSENFPMLQIVVTSRPHNEIQKINNFRTVKILPLTASDYGPFLQKLGLKTAKISDIRQAIHSSPSNVSQLITTPLMMTLVVFVYESESQIPAELPEFFERLFHTVFTRHDKLKAAFERTHYTGLSERRLQVLFESFCFMCLQGGNKRTLDQHQFSEAFDLAQDYVEGSNCEESDFKKDITKVACLMLEEGASDVTFLHKSIAEYHAAAFVKNSDDTFAQRFYQEACNGWLHWEECLRFLKNIDPYRFSKYFAISDLRQVIPLVEKLGQCMSGKEIAKLLPKSINSATLKYRKSESHFNSSSFGSWFSAEHYHLVGLSDAISDAIFETGPASLSFTEVADLLAVGKIHQGDGPDEVKISIAFVLEEWGFDIFLQKMRDLLYALERELAEATIRSDKITKRSLIFDRKPKTT